LSHFVAVDCQRGKSALADTSTVVLEAEFDGVFAGDQLIFASYGCTVDTDEVVVEDRRLMSLLKWDLYSRDC
jgi:hypothetical protein